MKNSFYNLEFFSTSYGAKIMFISVPLISLKDMVIFSLFSGLQMSNFNILYLYFFVYSLIFPQEHNPKKV